MKCGASLGLRSQAWPNVIILIIIIIIIMGICSGISTELAIRPLKSGLNWNLKIWVFEERGKPEYPEKNLLEQRRESSTNILFPWRRNFAPPCPYLPRCIKNTLHAMETKVCFSDLFQQLVCNFAFFPIITLHNCFSIILQSDATADFFF